MCKANLFADETRRIGNTKRTYIWNRQGACTNNWKKAKERSNNSNRCASSRISSYARIHDLLISRNKHRWSGLRFIAPLTSWLFSKFKFQSFWPVIFVVISMGKSWPISGGLWLSGVSSAPLAVRPFDRRQRHIESNRSRSRWHFYFSMITRDAFICSMTVCTMCFTVGSQIYICEIRIEDDEKLGECLWLVEMGGAH